MPTPDTTAAPRIADALQFAAIVHQHQVRKGTSVPYLAHLLGVCSLVAENGGDEDQVIAALLHDTIEDQAASFGGADATRAEIRRRFGERVLTIVDACTDADVIPKPPWRARKEAYLQHLTTAPVEALLVSGADKLHNARAIVADLQQHGPIVWNRFKGGRTGTLWYYRNLVQAFKQRVSGWIYDELARVVAEMRDIADKQSLSNEQDAEHHTKDRNGNVRHWWGALSAVPPTRESTAYHRLRRIWWDTTRFRGPRGRTDLPDLDANRYHEFTYLRDETHLTTTLWENFSLFDAQAWLSELLQIACLPSTGRVAACRWSYEWFHRWNDNSGQSHERMCDVVVEFTTSPAERHLLIVESKALRTPVTRDDLDPRYYLAIPEIAAYAGTKALLYLIDESVRNQLVAALDKRQADVGIVTWQQLAALQIQLAQRLDAAASLVNFIATAIQFQYAQNDIRPARLAFDYLETERSMAQIQAATEKKQPLTDHSERLWQIT